MQNPTFGTNQSQETICWKATLQKRNREDKDFSWKCVAKACSQFAASKTPTA